jgi:ankyrin repeat protein
MRSNRQLDLVRKARGGKISEMYELIANGADPFYFDRNGKSPLDYAIESDPIKAYTLLNDLDKVCSSEAKKDVLRHYISLAIRTGNNYAK